MITSCVMREKNWQVSYHPATQKELAKLPADLQARLLRLADMLGIHGPVLPMPDNRKIDKELFELRAKSLSGIARALYTVRDGQIILILTVFQKKDRRLRKHDINRAKSRAKS
ncbi:MAG: type II toxin-antitoxin system RelE/ParE family toxin [Candidatus Puniceispirillaceae bacterium]